MIYQDASFILSTLFSFSKSSSRTCCSLILNLLQLVRLIKNYCTPALLVLLLVSKENLTSFIYLFKYLVLLNIRWIVLWRQLYQIEHSHQTILLFAAVECMSIKNKLNSCNTCKFTGLSLIKAGFS
jgi:hypothetical protein